MTRLRSSGCLFFGGILAMVMAVGADAGAAADQPPSQTIVALRVHGNQTIADSDVIEWAGIGVGASVRSDVVAEVEERLRATGRFETVEVRKRYLSLTAEDEIALIVVVRERLVPASANLAARVIGELRTRALFLPLLDYTEGYGVTYGVQTSFVDVLGDNGRLSVPVTWGGTRRIAGELHKRLERGPLDRLHGGMALSSSENPHFEIDTDRTELWLVGERRLPGRLRIGAEARWSDVTFGERDDSLARYRATVEVDTRSDVSFPRNAVWARASYEWLKVSGRSRSVGRPRLEAEAYAGLIGQSVFVVRADYFGADAEVPPYEQPLLGGADSLRGWRAGEMAGDRRVAGSIELRVPFSSPLSIGRTGAVVFLDSGATYDVGQSLARVPFRNGAGAGVFLNAPLVQFRIVAAHNLIDDVRVHVSAVLSFSSL
jgi:outer membrane protein assembly factor BamA